MIPSNKKTFYKMKGHNRNGTTIPLRIVIPISFDIFPTKAHGCLLHGTQDVRYQWVIYCENVWFTEFLPAVDRILQTEVRLCRHY